MSDGKRCDAAGRLALLVVDDNPVARIAIGAVAARIGVDASPVASGEEAIASLDCNDFDAVLIDLGLPGIDGVALTRAIRSAGARWSGIAVVGMTAALRPGVEAHCIAAGMSAVLAKPVRREALKAALQQALASPA
jgi:CheY-like chemotaxis protein